MPDWTAGEDRALDAWLHGDPAEAQPEPEEEEEE